MIAVLVVWALLVVALWWTCWPGTGARRPAAAPAGDSPEHDAPSAGCAVLRPPLVPAPRDAARPPRRAAPRLRPPLTEDDLIAFGCGLEATSDVVGAVRRAGRGERVP